MSRTMVSLSLLLLLCLAPPALGLVSFDFEQPFFVEEQPNYCKDHAVVKHDGLYHVFYIQSLPPPPGWQLRAEFWLGHVTSPDLRHWTRQDSILPVAEVPDSWEDGFVWAPKVLRNPVGPGWLMYYTGVSWPAIAQQTGAAFSLDLWSWLRYPLNPIYAPGDWSDWDEDQWANCRDPELFTEDGETWYLLNTASTEDGWGAVSLGSSEDMVNWEDEGPLFVNDNISVPESPQLVKANGLYHLFYTEQWVGHTAHLTSPSMTSGWVPADATIIDVGNAPEISLLGEETLFSRHTGAYSIDGIYYSYRFDGMNFDTSDQVPEIIPRTGLAETWSVWFGEAFDNQPTFGDNPRERGGSTSNMEGNSYVSTYENYSFPLDGAPGGLQGNAPTGMIRTADFTVTGNRIGMLAAGTVDHTRLFVALVRAEDGRIWFIESGLNSHALDRRLWDCTDLAGETVYLVVSDMSDEGFIAVDSVVEYVETGEDSIPAVPPLPEGLDLEDLMRDAGFLAGVGDAPAPAAGRLLAPYPNPFNPRTRLRYELAREATVDLLVVDASGRRVRLLDGGRQGAGPGFFVWNGEDDGGSAMASGVYLATLRLDGQPTGSRRLVLLR